MLFEAADPRQHFQARNHSFQFTLQTDPRPRPANNMYIFFSCSKLVLQISNGFASVCLRNFVIESAYAPSTNDL